MRLSITTNKFSSSLRREINRANLVRESMSTALPPMATKTIHTADAATRKTVLITGVSRGLGNALALELARLGQTVIGCSRSQDKLATLESELTAASEKFKNNNHLVLNIDVRSDAGVKELARTVVEKKAVPDIIVNNAGTINRNNKIWDVPVDEFDAVIDTNIKGVANVLRHFTPLMIERKQGVIVNMSSGWGRSAAAQVAPYCASKWAIEGLTRAVAKELPPGMAIVALSPGVINTEMLRLCFGSSADLYPTPESWAPKAASMILNLTAADNGASLTV
ncbi:NADPH-dependent pterin aldehyde reductase [Primulina eburnea]|uniref:NADPH-dependent pterin aldehyde reductase n=1 Tax=Primulina eburnea TaxID=1245227 RepID=UPI003C6C24D5